MKFTKRSKAIVSIVLVLMMLLSVLTVGFVSVQAAGVLTLSYNFKYANAGYAEGRVELKAGSSADYGTYYLYWANDTKALDGYAPITTLTLNTSVKYFEFDEFTAIPADATKVIAVKSTTSKTVASASAVYDIPAEKQFVKSSTKQYDFQALSDIHIQHDDSYWVHSKSHFANALEMAAKRDVEFIAICGDQVNGYGYSNLEKEWPQYLRILADSSYANPIYETNGNHEIKGNGGSSAQTQDHSIYKIASGLNIETGKLPATTYYEKTINGDHYLFMTLEKSGSPNEYSEFSDEQLDWLEGLTKKYKDDGHKIILFQHALIKQYGAGDDLVSPYYGGALNPEFSDVKRFMSILEANKDIIWFSGHSHVDFKYKYNFSNMDGATAYTVHIPSTSSTTHPNASTGSNDYIMSPDSSQGYFVDVYDKYVVINGTDLVKNEILPAYTYFVDYTGEKLVENDMPDKPDVNYEKVQVEVDVKALSENPSSVKIKLYGADETSLTQEVSMSKTTAGTYVAEVSTQFTKMKFVVNGSSSGEYTVANCKVVLGGLKVKVNLADIKTKENGSCTGWAVVNAYAWNQSTNQNAGAWPGVAMTKDSDGSYTILLPGGLDPDMIIFNNGSSQTADLSITPYVVAEYEGSYTLTDGSGEIVTIPTESTAATEPDSEPDPENTATVYFVKDSAWPEVYIYGFYGVEGGTATGEPLGEYPGKKMTFVETDDNGKAIYSANIPADIDYIKFVDGTTTNRRTNNVGKAQIADGTCYALGSSAGTNKWDVTTYNYEAPTVPTETTPTETTPTVTETKPTETETQPTPVEYLYGDADLNGLVNIKDATTIQKFAADMIALDDVAFTQANVTGDKAVNVRDATAVQKHVAGLITEFPVEAKTAPAEVGVSSTEFSTLVSTVKKTLSDESYYASYNAYMALKKAYLTYKDSATDAGYEAINDALTAYNTMKKNNPNHVGSAASSGGSLPTGTTTNATSIDGSKTGTYAIRGSFNNWGNSGLEFMVQNSDGSYSISYQLTKGSYEFKFFDNSSSSWYGNTGTMEAGESGWTFTSGTGNCKLNATEDGIYVFTYKLDSSKVKISLSRK